tara:strand:+ start:438 stop:800 length:363 start_codon:yes stop_codon:yes gene_type:complete
MKFYQHEKCESCRKAKKWMAEKGLSFESVSIRETPPSKKELKAMLDAHEGQIKKLFNTSSKDYRDSEIKSNLPTMSEEDIISLLASRGNLIKRPFLIGDGIYLQGFKPELWKEAFNKTMG